MERPKLVPLGGGLNSNVYALAISDSNVLAGGAFTNAGGVSANRIARWNGSQWSALGTGMNDVVRAIALSGKSSTRAVILRMPAALASAMWHDGTAPLGRRSAPASVGRFAPSRWTGTNVYVAGSFAVAGSVISLGVARWNGSAWSAMGNPALNGSVYALAVSRGAVYVGGFFTTAGGSSANNVARWDGTNWSALGSGLGNGVFALAAGDSGVYAGGAFTNAGGVAAMYIARWDGTNWSALGSGTQSWVESLALRGPDLLAGGGFTTAGNHLANCFSIWHTGDASVPRIAQFHSSGA